jgi:1-deoxy-D-xylulose-5-phosphate reductoisomerase
MRRKLSIFGATGSVGCNTVSLVEDAGGPESFEVMALTGAGNVALLADQARRLRARIAVTADPARLAELREALAGTGTEAAAGPQALVDAACEGVDWAMLAIVGAAGLAPGLRLAEHAGTLALANKESLVCAGELMLARCAAHGTRLIPVDSEHSAIHQALAGEDAGAVERIILTASGGPFRDWPLERMAAASLEQARAHPNWDMGLRISIDSASMFNKAMEIIEAERLFGVAPEAIEVVIHPQSVIHSMVGFRDGAILAHLGPSDMRGAIGYALNWPERRPLPLERLDFARLGRLDFAVVDPERFPAVGLAYDTLRAGGLSGAVFNAAKETALDGFIAGRIGFLDMGTLVQHVTRDLNSEAAGCGARYDLTDVERLDAAARKAGRAWIDTNGRN